MDAHGANRSKSAAILLGLCLTYWLAIFIATHIPLTLTLPLKPMLAGWPKGLDKVEHCVAFAGLAILLSAAGTSWIRSPWQLYAAVFGLAAIYGVFDELTQILVPTRSADVRDWAADVTGAAIGVSVFALCHYWGRSK